MFVAAAYRRQFHFVRPQQVARTRPPHASDYFDAAFRKHPLRFARRQLMPPFAASRHAVYFAFAPQRGGRMSAVRADAADAERFH